MKGLTDGERETVLGGALRGVLQEQSKAIVAGMQSLFDAIVRLNSVRDSLAKFVERVPHGDPAEAVLLGVQRACTHLSEAELTIPDELWAALLAGRNVGVEEVRARFEQAARAA